MLKFKQTVNTSPSEVYRAFTSSTALRAWCCDVASLDPRKGGRLYLWWNSGYYACGEFTALTPDKRIAFTWYGRGEPKSTQVRISLAAKGDATIITLVHAGIGTGKLWAEAIEGSQQGWTVGLENLKSVLETGQDLRIVRRPMLGVDLGVVDAQAAARLGVPIWEGVSLDGVLEGKGAHAAGLQVGDVLVRIGDKRVTGFADFVEAVQLHQAGDQVAVVFYRGGEKKTVKVTFSPRPLPEVPATAAALADAIRQEYSKLDVEMSACFADVSESETAHRPASDQWSAKEALAHLIASERESQSWAADLINDDERWPDALKNPTNVSARLEATVSAFQTYAALLEELRRAEIETVAMVAALPADFVARKYAYWRLGYSFLLVSYHAHEHISQIRAAIEVARA